MIVTCEECGKKYRVDASKIKGRAASFKCQGCSRVIVVAKPRPTATQTPSRKNRKTIDPTPRENRLADDAAETGEAGPLPPEEAAATQRQSGSRGLGLRAKMLLLFLVIPLFLAAGAGSFYVWLSDTTSRSLVEELFATQPTESESSGQSANSGKTPMGAAAKQSRPKALMDRVRMIAIGVFGAALLISGMIVLVYAQRISRRIEGLTEVAERISLGEFDLQVETGKGDEIGKLAAAIAKIQQNIRMSMGRLHEPGKIERQ